MFENIASIDIGTSSIKVITAKTGIKDFKVKDFIYESFEESTDEAILEALTRIITENSLKDYKILTNLPMQKTAIRNMTFPFEDREKIEEIIPFEAEENIPFKLEDVIMDFQMLKSKEPGTGEVLLAAAQKESISGLLAPFNAIGIKPVYAGLESQSMFECYKYFNKIEDETIIQIDIGNEKSIINIISCNNLLFTRSIGIGAKSIYDALSDKYKLQHREIRKLFTEFNLDLTSFENNLQKEYQNTFNIKKSTLKGIYEKSVEIVYELVEQIILSRKAFSNDHSDLSFSRILISGGGSNISGIGSIISKELELPVVSLPFLEEYSESEIRSQFPIAFGIILCYLDKKYRAVSFLKDEYLPESSGYSIKRYYLAFAFIILSIAVLLINILVTSYMKSKSNEKYTEVLNERYKRYFRARQPVDDPISEANKLLKDEKKEYESIEALVHTDSKMMDILNDILSFFPKDYSFELRNLVINETVTRLDGKMSSATQINEFANKLKESKKFDDITPNYNMSKGNDVFFTMTIKLKIQKKATEN